MDWRRSSHACTYPTLPTVPSLVVSLPFPPFTIPIALLAATPSPCTEQQPDFNGRNSVLLLRRVVDTGGGSSAGDDDCGDGDACVAGVCGGSGAGGGVLTV